MNKPLLKWSKDPELSDIWIGNNRYWITYKHNRFITDMFHEGEVVAFDEFNTLKQAKAWCEKKERKRVKNDV